VHPTALNTATRYRVLLLGPFRLERDGIPLDVGAWQSRVQTLFKLLATAPNRQRLRDDLIDILWPDAAPDTAAGNLRMLVHRLRLTLGAGGPSPVLSDHGWITLNPAYDWELDLDRLEALLRDSDGGIGVLEQAAELCRGEPLIEDRYEDWAAPIRERAQRTWRDLTLRLASLHRSRGSFDESIRWYERALEADPLDEEALRGLLAVLSVVGRPADAVRRYQQFEHRLAEEMDVPPSPETLELIQGIRTKLSDPSSSPRGREGPLTVGRFLGSIPEGPLVGREEELERILFAVEAAESGSGRLVLLAGEPGLGKTRLAQEAMMQLLDRGFVAVANSCYEQHRAIPFYPFLDLLARAAAAAPPSIRRQTPQRWPHLHALLPDETGVAEADGAEEQYLLFRAVTGFLTAMADNQPLAILLDDLQWADEGSLELLQHLARQTRGSRVLLLATYRDSDISNEHPLGIAVRALTRDGLLERLTLRHLSPEKTAVLITAMLGEMAGAQEFADFVYRRTKGSPYFIHKMVQTLGGRYRLVRQIGMGGMGRVFEALDVQTGERVAAKIMFSRTEISSRALLRFQQEAAVLAALDHPNIVKIHTTVADEHTSCIIMELLDGRALGHLLGDPEDGRQLSLASIRELMRQVAGALAAAHERGIVHRDIKPDNMIVGADNHVTVTDFGIARLVRPRGDASVLTSTGMTMGTPLYMAPEQIEGKKVDGRADIYALGAVMYQLVTGRPPFEGGDPLSIAFKHVNQPPDPPSWLNANLPEDWEALILKALAKDPASRFQTAVAMERAIAGLNTEVSAASTLPHAAKRRGSILSRGSAIAVPPGSDEYELAEGRGPALSPEGGGRRRGMGSWGTRVSRRGALVGAATLLVVAVATGLLVGRAFSPATSETSSGSGPGQFRGPTGIALDRSGNVYVVDQANNRIQELSPDGMPIYQWGALGKGSLQFDSPSDIAVGPDGTIYVSDIGNKRIVKLRSGHEVDEIPFDGGSLAIDRGGNLYVTDYYNSRIAKFSPNSDTPAYVVPVRGLEVGGLSFPAGIAVDAQGNIYVADREHNQIKRFSPAGIQLRYLGTSGSLPGQFDKPTDVAIDRHGNIYVADAKNNRVQKLSPDGVPLAHWGSLGSRLGQFIQPSSIAVDAQGDIYVADYYNDRVQKLSPGGTALWATRGSSPIRH
jgi:serine/threonine protein kinase, bacterial